MIYREAGQFKTSYAADQAVFPIVQDRVVVGAFLALAFVLPPALASEYWLQAVLIPFLVYAMATVGLNLLTGYAGQVSLGTGGFMAVGAYAAFKLTTGFPGLSILLVFVLAGVIAALVGIVFGLPSLRIKGFYLAVATLAAQFFLIWLFNKVGWFVNYASSGTITAPPRTVMGFMVTGPEATAAARYVVALGLVVVFGMIAKNLVRGRIGRSWMAIRDRDIAAEIIGVRPGRYKVGAFAVSSGMAAAGGALFGSYQQYVSPDEWSLFLSIQYIAIIIVGGIGTIFGAIVGAVFLGGMPGLIDRYSDSIPFVATSATDDGFISVFSLNQAIFGLLIVLFLVFEPRGLAAVWLRTKAYFRSWPFSY